MQFTLADAQNVVSAFCAQNYVLQPGNTYGFAEGDDQTGYTVIAAAAWAQNQAGCGTEQDFSFSAQPDFCLAGWSTDYYCTDESGTGSDPTSYGGAYVLEPPGSVGCILLSLYAYSTSSSKRWLSIPGVSPGPVIYNSTAEHKNLTALQHHANGTVPSMWPVASQGNGNHPALFNQSMLALLLNGTAMN